MEGNKKTYGAPRPPLCNTFPRLMRLWNVAKNGFVMIGNNLAFEPKGIKTEKPGSIWFIRWPLYLLTAAAILYVWIMEILCDYSNKRRL